MQKTIANNVMNITNEDIAISFQPAFIGFFNADECVKNLACGLISCSINFKSDYLRVNQWIGSLIKLHPEILKAILLQGYFATLVNTDHLAHWGNNDDAYTTIIQAMKQLMLELEKK